MTASAHIAQTSALFRAEIARLDRDIAALNQQRARYAIALAAVDELARNENPEGPAFIEPPSQSAPPGTVDRTLRLFGGEPIAEVKA